MKNAEIAELLNKAAHALMGGIPLTDKSKEQLVKELLFAAVALPQAQTPPALTAKIVLRDIKSADGWSTLVSALQIPPSVAERYFEHGDFATIEIEVDHVLNITGGRVLPIAHLKPTLQHTRTRGMTADIPPPRTKPRGTGMSCPHCGAGLDELDELGHKSDCPLRNGAAKTPITRHPRYGTDPFAICHWDTFDSDDEDGGVSLVDGADTLEEAIQKVKVHYGDRLKDTGADQVDIIDYAGNIVWKHRVG